MNSYYHQLNVGFNLWYIAMPGCLIVFMVLGSLKYYVVPTTGYIKSRGVYYELLLKMLTCVADVGIFFLMAAESLNGILQFFANLLASEDSPFWALIVAFTAIISGIIFYYYALTFCAKVGGWAKLGYFKEHKPTKPRT